MQRSVSDFGEFDSFIQKLIIVVSDVLKVEDYHQMFSRFDRKFDDAKFVCYKVLYDRGYSFNRIGIKLNKSHSSIIHGIGVAKKRKDICELANLVNRRLELNELSEDENKIAKIKDMLNKGESESDIIKEFNDISQQTIENVLKNIKEKSKKKLIYNYKEGKAREVFL